MTQELPSPAVPETATAAMDACIFLVSPQICSHNSESSHHSRHSSSHSSPSMLSRRSPGSHAARGLLHVRSRPNMILVYNMDPIELRMHSRNGGYRRRHQMQDNASRRSNCFDFVAGGCPAQNGLLTRRKTSQSPSTPPPTSFLPSTCPAPPSCLGHLGL